MIFQAMTTLVQEANIQVINLFPFSISLRCSFVFHMLKGDVMAFSESLF